MIEPKKVDSEAIKYTLKLKKAVSRIKLAKMPDSFFKKSIGQDTKVSPIGAKRRHP
jgi:hypothetical protein